jgi:threonine/homoserine/homoserine lactone efflux protein
MSLDWGTRSPPVPNPDGRCGGILGRVLTEAVGDLLSSAAAVALSPIPIIAVVMVLGTPRARTSGPAFALGWVLGLGVASVIVVLLLSDADDPDSDAATGVGWIEVAIGLLFLGMAAKQWRKRPERGQPPEMPKWMATLGSVTPARATCLGLALSGANPKNLALTFAAAAAIAEAGLDSTDTVLAVAAFVVVGSITVAGSVSLYLIDADRAARPLATVKQFMSDHNAVIMMVILLLLGAKLLGNGLGGLWE